MKGYTLHYYITKRTSPGMIQLSQKWDPMGVFTLALVHLIITHTKQFIVKLDFISCMIYNAVPPYGGYRHYGLTVVVFLYTFIIVLVLVRSLFCVLATCVNGCFLQVNNTLIILLCVLVSGC